jgi:hypothetical protein
MFEVNIVYNENIYSLYHNVIQNISTLNAILITHNKPKLFKNSPKSLWAMLRLGIDTEFPDQSQFYVPKN